MRLAVIPGAGGTQRLPRVVGAARAKELILTGRVLTRDRGRGDRPRQPRRAGRAAPSRPPTSSAPRSRSAGPVAVREAKRLIDDALDRDIGAGLEAEFEASERIFATEDMVEGARAFFEKRDPNYTGR